MTGHDNLMLIDLEGNLINDIKEILCLSSCELLYSLNIIGNTCCSNENINIIKKNFP